MKEVGGTLDVGQWELHPWLQRGDIVSWCRERGVVIEAYCPLVRGQRAEEVGWEIWEDVGAGSCQMEFTEGQCHFGRATRGLGC
jgi:diketogulonate reductase-like aldo/keto reductase